MPDAHCGADLYNEDDRRVLPTCQCGWEGERVSTYDEAADAYALHRIDALVRSEAVRAALVDALIAAVCVHSDGRRFCIECDVDAILAALAPEAT